MKNKMLLVYMLAIVKFILPFLLQDPSYQPHRDEFLYLAQGSHLAWGFMEVPPLLSIFACLTHVMGDGFFVIKLWPSLFGAFTFVLTARIIITLGGRSFAIVLAFLPFIFGAYLRVHYLFQPNFLEIFFYTLIAFTLIEFIYTQKNKWLYWFGIACGLGMLSKYSVAFFILAVLVGLLVTPERKVFANKHFWFGSLIALILFLPNMIWQFTHNFPVAHHMDELKRTQLQFINPADFLKDQVLMNLPCFYTWLAGLLCLLFSSKTKPYRFVLVAYITVILLLLYFQGKNYYALGLYPVLFAFGGFWLELLTVKRVRFMRIIFIMYSFFLGIFFIPLALPVFKPLELAAFYRNNNYAKTGALKWEDLQNHPLPQDFADMKGWREIAQQTASVYNDLSEEEKNKTLIKCENYGLCGALNFYGKKLGLPETYSYNGSFLTWTPDKFHIANVITIGEDFPDTTRAIVKQFRRISIEGELKDSLARQNGTKIILWKQCDPAVLSKFIEAEVAERKAKFTRR